MQSPASGNQIIMPTAACDKNPVKGEWEISVFPPSSVGQWFWKQTVSKVYLSSNYIKHKHTSLLRSLLAEE